MMNNKINETLVILQEECAEVIQEVSKCFRFGIDSMHKDGIVHRAKLEMEIGDMLAMVDILLNQGVITQKNLDLAKQNKVNKLKIYSSIYED